MTGPPRKTLYYFELRVLAYKILIAFEEAHWGTVAWESKQSLLRAIRMLEKRRKEFNHERAETGR